MNRQQGESLAGPGSLEVSAREQLEYAAGLDFVENQRVDQDSTATVCQWHQQLATAAVGKRQSILLCLVLELRHRPAVFGRIQPWYRRMRTHARVDHRPQQRQAGAQSGTQRLVRYTAWWRR